MMQIDAICWSCRRLAPSLILRAFGGYADGPRSSCDDCYLGDHMTGRYARGRFRAYRPQGDGYLILPDWRGKLPPTSDGGPVEMLAAALAAAEIDTGDWTFADATEDELDGAILGWIDWASTTGTPSILDESIIAGWLARQIVEGGE